MLNKVLLEYVTLIQRIILLFQVPKYFCWNQEVMIELFVFISGVKRNKSFSGGDFLGSLLNQFQNTAKELTLDFGPPLWRRRNTSFAVNIQNTSGLIPKSEIKTTAVQGNCCFDQIFLILFKNYSAKLSKYFIKYFISGGSISKIICWWEVAWLFFFLNLAELSVSVFKLWYNTISELSMSNFKLWYKFCQKFQICWSKN